MLDIISVTFLYVTPAMASWCWVASRCRSWRASDRGREWTRFLSHTPAQPVIDNGTRMNKVETDGDAHRAMSSRSLQVQ